MGSLSAEAGYHGQSNSAAAKAGVQGLTRSLGRECARRSLRVNAVAPSRIDTSVPATIPAEMQKAIPWRRFGQAQEVADAVLFLCSPLAGYITGHTLRVDGGWRG